MPRLMISSLAGGPLAALPLAAFAQSSQVAALPEGEGKDLVEGVCTACHQTNQITRSSGYSEDGWREIMSTMIDLSGDPQMRDELAGYLATHFPPSGNRAATLVPGDHEVTFREWQVPTLGQRSRDPVEAADGTIWWAGQWGNLIGRIDPDSGEMTEYPLPANAMPHTVTVDAEGKVWYTGNKNGSMGRFDPETEEITVYEMPDPAARDPHSAIFDAEGILWFTLQQSNMIGRLDPASGEVKLVTPPTAGSRPYGIKLDAEGTPWVACNGSNCLLRVDPATMELTEVKLPTPGTTVRRLDIAEDGMIWYVNSSKGRIGRYDPASGEIKEWDSPSGPTSHPYALAVIDGIVWYNESGVRPDPLVRFDPATETFQSWAIPSGGIYAGIIRHMRPTRDGNLLIHQSSTNRIILVNLKGAMATQ
jgi:virginiamycin B lyase